MIDMIQYYKELLAKFDFYYRQSDDPRFLDKFITMEREIEKLRREIDKSDVIYKKYCPYV